MSAPTAISHIAISRRLPALGDDPDYSRVIYPDPPSHDFCVWLIIAELMRRYHGAPSPLRVSFVWLNGQLGIFDFGPFSLLQRKGWMCNLSRQYSDTMLANVLRPAMTMIGATEENAINYEWLMDGNEHQYSRHVEYDYHIGHLIDASRQGHVIPQWQVPQWAYKEVDAFLCGKKPVVITLREAPAQPERNSRIGEWFRFARSIENEHPVLFLRDTCNADQDLDGFATWERASRDVFVRAALYQRAFVNMMVCNGCNTWCIFSNAPYLIFKQLVPELPGWEHGEPKGWKEQDHMDVGDQNPWALPSQRMAWADDTYDNIRAHFDALRGELYQLAA